MNLKNMMDDNYLTFYMLSDNYVNKEYSKINLSVYVSKKIFRYIKKSLLHFFIFFRYFSLNKNYCNKIIFYTISKNNYDSLSPVYKELKKYSIILSSDYRLARNALLIPMIIPLIISIFFIPALFNKIFNSVPKVRKRIILYLDDILLSMGFTIFVKYYLKLLKPKAIVFANDHSFYARSLIKSAEGMNIPCFYIQHSAITEIFPPIISSYALLEGEDSLTKYYNSEQLEKGVYLIGSPKFDKHYKKINNNKKIKSIGICSTDSMDKDQVLELIYMVKNKFNKNTIYFRPHPGERISGKYKNNKILDSINFSDPLKEDSFNFLKKVDVIISGNSSIILESTMMNVYPILWLDSKATSKYNDNPNDKYGFIENSLAVGCNSIDQINECVKNILHNKPNVRDKAKFYIENINTEWDGQSANYAATIIRNNI